MGFDNGCTLNILSLCVFVSIDENGKIKLQERSCIHISKDTNAIHTYDIRQPKAFSSIPVIRMELNPDMAF